MAQGQIIETKGILLQVIKDLTKYKDEVDKIMKSILQKTNELNNDWKDAQYTKFQAYIEDIKKGIDNDLKELDECVAVLKKRAELY